MQDLGPVRDIDGRVVRGSDPEFKRESDRFILHHTWGPTDPSRPGGSSPGIYRRISEKGPLEGLSRPELILAPDHDEGEAGVETFTCEYHPRGVWIACAGLYTPNKTRRWFRFYWSKDLLGKWEPYLDLHPELGWEQHHVAECALTYSEHYRCMVMTYSAKSDPPNVRWSTGWMFSVDLLHWSRALHPFAVPPGVFGEPGKINSYSHSESYDDEEQPEVICCITTESGDVNTERKGLTGWVFENGIWKKDAELFVTAKQVDNMTHIGGPSVFQGHGDQLLGIHAERDRRENTVKRHIRVLATDDA